MHLAQLNVAHLREPLDSLTLADFVAALEPINALSDAAPGFVWRMKGGEDPTDTIRHDYGDDLLVNFSIWESRETLWNFVYRSAHLPVMRRRLEWFHRAAEPYTVMWWVPEGYRPSLAEAMARLSVLRAEGAGPEAFTFREFYDSSEAASRPAAAEVRK
ncbi:MULTISPECIES: DUF3291 domain-containing protein [Microbispora]|uniref:DUF3291 domain-containing protein n=2 Tax=Microbispora TaxID=2005 RepID=A0ABY3M1P5_9ACTN|nr:MULTISPECIES: DUF3291 domain-containing protein [Microbispora]TLP59716.1 DUF3291 domain-containing protein [Microbispora fusca]TYB63430.1 DUF3291 domain-containing protein [Microbispora tritici]